MRAIALAAGGLLIAAVAIAAADIPPRYVGPLPSFFVSSGPFRAYTDVTAIFAGKSLSLKYVVLRASDNKRVQVAATYTCAVELPNRTSCSGQFKTNEGKTGPAYVEIVWKDGQPVSTRFGKR